MSNKNNKFWQRWRNEPARIIYLSLIVLEAIVAFGFMDLSQDQIDSIIMIMALTLGAGEGIRTQVSPADKVEKEVEKRVSQILERRNRPDKIGTML